MGSPGQCIKIAPNGKQDVGLLKVLPELASSGVLGRQRSPSPGDAGSRTLPPASPGRISPHFAFTEPSRVLRASARWPAMPRKARRSSPRATLQHDTANKGVFLSCLGAGTQLLPFKGSNCFHKRQPDQQSPFALVYEPSLDVFSSSETFVHPLFILGSPKAV